MEERLNNYQSMSTRLAMHRLRLQNKTYTSSRSDKSFSTAHSVVTEDNCMKERVANIQSKISEIQVEISNAKTGHAANFRQRLLSAENTFEDALDANRKVLQTLDQQMQHTIDLMDEESKAKQLQIQVRRIEMESRKNLLEKKFQQIDQDRQNFSQKMVLKLSEQEQQIQQNLILEGQQLSEQVSALHTMVSKEIPKIYLQVQNSSEERKAVDNDHNQYFTSKIQEQCQRIQSESESREETQDQLTEMFKESFEKVSIQVEREKHDREECQEGLLNLIEETTHKLTKRAAL